MKMRDYALKWERKALTTKDTKYHEGFHAPAFFS